MMTFNKYIQDETILKTLEALGYELMLPVQNQVIPVLKQKKDCIIQSKTGSGKTLSFVLPLIDSFEVDKKSVQAIVLAPTRELALQIKEEFDRMGRLKKIKALCITGKQSYQDQVLDLKQRVHVCIGTPGRLLDHIENGNLNVESVNYLILDEADEMLNKDFIEDIYKIISYLPEDICSAIFSATYPLKIKEIAKDLLKDPVFIQIEQEKNKIEETFYSVLEKEKNIKLCQCLSCILPESCIVFCRTQNRCEEVYELLKSYQVNCQRLHAGLIQEKRFEIMKDFKEGKIRILISTDVCSRGIDIQKVDCIINYDMPDTSFSYIHRIGRSARVNESGKAITFISEMDQEKKLKLQEELSVLIECKDLDGNIDLSSLSKRARYNSKKDSDLIKNITKIYINAGKSKKIRAKDILGALCQIDGITFEDIGIIQIQNHQSYVDILNGKGNLVIQSLKTIKNKKIKVEIAKE